MNKKTLIVIGNGPSLKDVDFSLLDGLDTFGLNSAYRVYEKLNWYPTYHGCFDYVVTDSHRDSFVKLINTGKIRTHFHIRDLSSKENFQFINLIPYNSSDKMNSCVDDFGNFHDNGNSGANACSVGVCLGYKKIILLGVDCNYVEFIDGCKKEGNKLVMDKTPETNPNYWFDDYQQKGDEYNVPHGQGFHKPTWNRFAYRCAQSNIEVVNCSPTSTLRCFRQSSLSEEL
jgi:hypothetical protein